MQVTVYFIYVDTNNIQTLEKKNKKQKTKPNSQYL